MPTNEELLEGYCKNLRFGIIPGRHRKHMKELIENARQTGREEQAKIGCPWTKNRLKEVLDENADFADRICTLNQENARLRKTLRDADVELDDITSYLEDAFPSAHITLIELFALQKKLREAAEVKG